MTAFPDRLVIEALNPDELRLKQSRCQLWTLRQDFRYVSARWGTIVAHAGLETDFASVPRITKAIIDDDDPRILGPSQAHDALYHLCGETPARIFSRRECDMVLRDAMRDAGSSWLLSRIVYWALRAFGWWAWRNAKRNRKKGQL